MDYEISVIVPIYNSEKYLEKCIDSIRNQTIYNIEIILINDGSTDGSKYICDMFKKLDKRIKVIHTENKGVSHARNVGIKNSTGSYIMFADSDDYVDMNWCKDMLVQQKRYNESFIMCGYLIWNEKLKNKSLIIFNNNEIQKIHKSKFMEVYKEGLLNSPVNKIYIKRILQEKNILFNPSLSLGEDLVFNLEYMKYCSKNLIIVNRGLYNYIVRDTDSLSSKYYYNLFEIYTYLNQMLYKSMIDNNVNIERYNSIYWKSYFIMMQDVLKNTMSNNNNISWHKKIKYNNSILNLNEFKIALSYMTKDDVGYKYFNALKTRNYYIIWLLNTCSEFKRNVKIKLNLNKR